MSEALWAPFRAGLPKTRNGLHLRAMTDSIDRLFTALADRYAIERQLGSGGMGMNIEYRISNTEYRDRSVHHHFNIPCSIFSSVFLVQYSIFDILPGA